VTPGRRGPSAKATDKRAITGVPFPQAGYAWSAARSELANIYPRARSVPRRGAGRPHLAADVSPSARKAKSRGSLRLASYREANAVADPPKPPTLGEAVQRLSQSVRRVAGLSQSATVLVACAVLDAELERALKVTMWPTNSAVSRLFKDYGPLSSFSSKIDRAYALNITTEEVHANLRIIKDIRNKFAHTAEILTLESESIQTLYQRLRKPAKPKDNSSTGIFVECADEVVSVLEDYLKSEGEPDDLSIRAHATFAEL
jgi:DNA-binding MltR family transcriptional regulator